MRGAKHLRLFKDHLDNVLVIVRLGSLLRDVAKNETIHVNPHQW
jgi:hypothetical protein